MTCNKVRDRLPGYLDGALRGDDHGRVREHLESCAGCRQDLERYARLSAVLARVERVPPPADLPVRIRVAATGRRDAAGWLARAWSRSGVILENMLQPLAVPATGGFMTALLVFALVAHNLFLGLPLGAVANDPPINLLQPARVDRLAHFPITTTLEDGPGIVVVEVEVNARGEVASYRILDGPQDEGVDRQVYQILLFSRFHPQKSFGRAESGGRLVLQFTEIRVRG